MKKHTKRFLAFLLATVMVLTGVPMNAKEVKAAEGDFVLDFGHPTNGVVSPIDGSVGPLVHSTSTTYSLQITTSLAGNGWAINTTKTTIPTLESDPTLYVLSASEGALIHAPKSNKSGFANELEFANLICLRLAPGCAIAYDFEVLEAGEYLLSMLYVNTGKSPATVTVNDTEFPSLIPGGVGGNSDVKTDAVVVNLNAGTNTIVVSTESATAYSGLRAAYFTKVVETPEATEEPVATPEPTEEPVVDTGAFMLDFTSVTTDSAGDLTANSYGENWKVHTLGKSFNNVSDGDYVEFGGIDSTSVFAVTAPESATYDMTFTFQQTNGTTDADVYVNDTFVGTVKTTKSETADRGYAISSVNLYGTEYGNTIKFVTKAADTATAPDWNGDYKLRLVKIDFAKSEVQVPFPEPTEAPTPEPTEEPVPDGSIHITSANIDSSTIYDSNGDGKYMYFTSSTKPTVESGENWSINTEKSHPNTYFDGSEGDACGAARYYGNNWVVSLTETPLVLDFIASVEGKYDISVDIEAYAKGGYVKIFIDDAYVGTVDGYAATVQSVTQNVLSVDLTAGKHTIEMLPFAISSGNDYKCKFEAFHFVPAEDAGKEITGLTAEIDNAALDLAVEATAQITSVVSTTDSDVIYFPTYTVDVENVVEVAWNGEVTPVGAGNANITVTAGAYSETIPVSVADNRTYTVTWANEDGSVLETDENVKYGETPSYDGSTPTKAADAQYTYTFAGWDAEVEAVTCDVTYTATYESTVNEYEVLWTDGAGKVLETDLVPYGAVPTYDGETPVKEADKVNAYTFAGWDREVEAVTGATSYAAQFDATPIEYTITFVVNGEEISNTYCYGAEVAVPEVEGYEDTFFTYAFANWDKDVVAVEGDATYTAVFEATAKAYAEAIKANDRTFGEVTADGNVVTVKVTGEVEYAGSVVSQGVWNNWVGFAVEVPAGIDAAQAKVLSVASGSVWTLAECLDTETEANFYWGIATATTTERTYQIDWNGDGEYDLDVVIDVADATLLTKTFNITWVVNGEPSTVAVTAGTMPEAPVVEDYATEDKNYTFAGWDADIAVAEADATYTAVFTATTRTYTVTWVNFNGEVLATEEYEYGATPEVPEAPTYKEYAFLGWDAEIVAVTGEATYTAIYDIDGIDEGYYYADGKVKGNAGVVQIGEDLYFVCYSGKIAAGQNMTVPANKTNGLVEAGTYYFYEDGTMKNPADDFKGEIVDVDGTLWYYVKDEVRGNVGLVKVGEYYYYVHYSGKVVRDGNQTVSAAKANTDKTGIEAGTYYFFEDGVMLTNELKTTGGVVGEDGYYYVRGKLTKNVGLVKLGEDFYYVHYSGKVVQNGYQTVTEAKANGHTEFVGVRKFVDGVMVK